MIQSIYQLLIIALPLIWLLVASIQDIKRKEVENWLSFSLLAFGISINLFFSILNKSYKNLIYMIIMLIILTIISLALYYGRIFGGGDAKLLIALSPFLILTPTFFRNPINFFNMPFVIIFLLNVVFIGSIYGLIFSIILAVKNKKKFAESFNKKRKKKKVKLFLIWSFLLSLFFLAIFVLCKEFSFLILFIIFVIFPLLFLFIKSVEESSMIILVDTKRLTEGDWIAERIRIKINRKIKIIKPSEGLSIGEIKLLRKYEKKVLIKQGIPFVPIFFVAFLISLFYNLLIEFVILFV